MRRRICILILGHLLAMIAVHAQEIQDRSLSRLPGYRTVTPAGENALQIPVAPLEGTVDPSEYIVGGNDVFALVLGGTKEPPVPLTVSPEGLLVIPNVGEVNVAGRTLGETKRIVAEQVRKFFKVGQVSVTLMAPRQFLVTVLGVVRNPGPYVASATLRVDKIVALANLDGKEGIPPPECSRRHIILRRQGSPDRSVDIELFHATLRKEWNPLLQEGDVIVVPARNLERGSLTILGAVNQPGEYEYRNRDSLGHLIRMAHGLAQNADPESVELTRFSPDGNAAASQIIDVTGILEGSRADIVLENRDRLVVKEKPDRRRDYKVHVRGEVVYPGMYPITPDSTTLTEVIRRAGGFTPYAYLASAEVERKQLTPWGANVNMTAEALVNLRMSDQIVTPEERAYYDLEAQLRRGTVAVDFAQLFGSNDRSKDIYLQDGDIVFVPREPKSVYVYGQVPQPGFVSYKQGADPLYYIRQAGGFGAEADEGKMRIIKGKTREWKDPADTSVEPGDFIWVPKEIHYPFGYYLNLFSQAASFVSVVLSMTIIILQLTTN